METGPITSKYQTVRLLARGGMGEVYLARQDGPAGFQKTIVLKKILKELATDETFVEMFLNEARLAAVLSHPNIVQIFDLGEEQDSFYIAMEYVHGVSLRALRSRLYQQGKPFPSPLAAFICAQALHGLHYAHTLADEQGKPLEVVHRDVSPDNVLIASNGSIKLVDFGIAKAAVLNPTTRAGTLKGKFAYMAPEHIRGETIDGRADVYSMGVVLFELLTNARPFNASSEPALLQAILTLPPPLPRTLNPNTPDLLQEITLRALQKDPKERFTSAEEMATALEDYLSTAGMRPTPAQIGAVLREHFPPDGGTGGVGRIAPATSTAARRSPPFQHSGIRSLEFT